MFGCLGNFIKAGILLLAVIGFVAIGGVTFFKDFIKNPFAQSQATKMEKATEIADFSKLDSEFELVSSSKLPKIGNYVYVKHIASSQKFFFAKPSKKHTLTKNDFNTKEADVKILSFINEIKVMQFENFEITGRGSISAFGQNVPFVKIQSDIVNFPVHGVQGIVGVAYKDNANIIIVAVNSDGKYSQIITNVLLNQLK